MSIVDQHSELKETISADVLAMQVGDFYEFFGEDATRVGKELGLQVSSRSDNGEDVPMAGVPLNDIDTYIETLVDKKGFTVGVADQYQTESGSYEREISRVVTPGTLLKSEKGSPRYIASIIIETSSKVGIAFGCLNTGTVMVTEKSIDSILDTLSVYNPEEVLIQQSNKYTSVNLQEIQERIESNLSTIVRLTQTEADISTLQKSVENHYGSEITRSLDFSDTSIPLASAGRIITYISEIQPQLINSLTTLQSLQSSNYMDLDARTRRSLELTDTLYKDSGISLLETMDHTVTTNGYQKLQETIQQPLLSKAEITERQEIIESFCKSGIARSTIQSKLHELPNILHLCSKISHGTASPKQVQSLTSGIDTIKQINNSITNDSRLSETKLAEEFEQIEYPILQSIQQFIKTTLAENVSNSVTLGTISHGYDSELDKLIDEYNSIDNWFSNLEAEIQENHGLSRVTVDKTQTDGYYIQVGKSQSEDVPEEWDQIKQLKSSVRFKNSGIQKREDKYLRLQEQREEKEKEIFSKFLDDLAEHTEFLQHIGKLVAKVDMFQSLSQHAIENNWIKPSISEENSGISISDGRHPVVEQTEDFTPNSISLTRENSFSIVTGPNMSGKSTYLRQTAIICILTQIGSFIPAQSAEIQLIDGIYTRIGAMDEISTGRSTFMVEMSELSHILHSASDNSLVILDEVGRGTSTDDGVSIAEATVRYLTESSEGPRPYSLFATHYHQLTNLSTEIPTISNLHFSMDPTENTFDRSIKTGATNDSYGIEVAEMAGVPKPVIEDAKSRLNNT